MVSRCFRRAILSVTATTILIGQQILAKSVIAQTQETLLPPVVAAKWLAYQQPNKPESTTVYSDADKACKGYEYQYEENGIQYIQTLEDTELLYTQDGRVAGARCWLNWKPNGYKYFLDVALECPAKNYLAEYIYTGGTNGKCILTSILEWDPIIQASYPGQPLKGVNITNKTWLPLIASLGLEGAVAAVIGLIGLGAYIKEYPPQIPNVSNQESEEPSVNIDDKIKDQMGKRGWTEGEIKETIKNPDHKLPARDTRNNPKTGTKNDDPATIYIKGKDYVVVNDVTKDVVQINDKNKPGWKYPF